MRKWARILALLAGVLASAALPCLPALAVESPCTMPGCEESSFGRVTTATCCCASSNAPAEASDAKLLAGPETRGLTVAAGAPRAGTAPAMQAAGEAALVPPDPVPLYLLHATLLI